MFENIRLLVFDFDGVMTDNRVLVDEGGREAVFCHRGDGWGVAALRKAGLDMIVLSTEENPVVAARCAKLNLPCIQGSKDKLEDLERLCAEKDIEPAEVAYMGNDENDLACMTWVGLPIAVADAVPTILAKARLLMSAKGGHGAIRELADRLLQDGAARDH